MRWEEIRQTGVSRALKDGKNDYSSSVYVHFTSFAHHEVIWLNPSEPTRRFRHFSSALTLSFCMICYWRPPKGFMSEWHSLNGRAGFMGCRCFASEMNRMPESSSSLLLLLLHPDLNAFSIPLAHAVAPRPFTGICHKRSYNAALYDYSWNRVLNYVNLSQLAFWLPMLLFL